MDLPFVFGLTSRPSTRIFSGLTNTARRLSTRMQHAWIRFARFGNPGHERLPEWDAYDSETQATMVFDRECTLADGPLHGERRLIRAWS
jgi:para-nitrobenzyl esterase